MTTVSFTQMKDGTKADYDLLAEAEKPYHALTADRILRELRKQDEDTLSGYKITRMAHGLQAATRARREGADIDWIVGALLHDVGDGLAPQNHDRFSAEVIRPFVRDEVAWVVEHHGIFQTLYYGRHYGWDENARDAFKDHIHFQACADFCERWDQSSFDPEFATDPLESFEALVRDVFARKAFSPSVIQEGVSTGVPRLTE
jgi:predicted HD phosphohydrolase